MGKEIDLLINYPKAKRNVDERGAEKTEEDRALARKFGKDFLMVIEKMVMEALVICPGFGSQLFQHLRIIGT